MPPEQRWELADGYAVAARGAVTDDAVAALWAADGVLTEAERRRRAGEVFLVAFGPGEELVGLSTAYLDHAARPGMELWHYRTYVARAHRRSAVGVALAILGREHLEARYASGEDRSAGGIAYVVQNAGLKVSQPEAVWEPIDFAYLGENDAGDDIRVHFFPGAPAPAPPELVPARTLRSGHRAAVRGPEISDEALVAFWAEAGVLAPEEARKRLAEVVVVGTSEAGAVVAVGTAFLAVHPQLRMPLWHYRTFVAEGARQGELALTLSAMARAHLEARWTAGIDRRGAGLVYDLQSPILRRHFPEAVWPRTGMAFIGARPEADMRVRYFPGALAPLPAS